MIDPKELAARTPQAEWEELERRLIAWQRGAEDVIGVNLPDRKYHDLCQLAVDALPALLLAARKAASLADENARLRERLASAEQLERNGSEIPFLLPPAGENPHWWLVVSEEKALEFETYGEALDHFGQSDTR